MLKDAHDVDAASSPTPPTPPNATALSISASTLPDLTARCRNTKALLPDLSARLGDVPGDDDQRQVALRVLHNAPYLVDLASFSHWDLIFAPSLGDLAAFLCALDEGDGRGFLEATHRRWVRIPRREQASIGAFGAARLFFFFIRPLLFSHNVLPNSPQ